MIPLSNGRKKSGEGFLLALFLYDVDDSEGLGLFFFGSWREGGGMEAYERFSFHVPTVLVIIYVETWAMSIVMSQVSAKEFSAVTNRFTEDHSASVNIAIVITAHHPTATLEQSLVS